MADKVVYCPNIKNQDGDYLTQLQILIQNICKKDYKVLFCSCEQFKYFCRKCLGIIQENYYQGVSSFYCLYDNDDIQSIINEVRIQNPEASICLVDISLENINLENVKWGFLSSNAID